MKIQRPDIMMCVHARRQTDCAVAATAAAGLHGWSMPRCYWVFALVASRTVAMYVYM